MIFHLECIMVSLSGEFEKKGGGEEGGVLSPGDVGGEGPRWAKEDKNPGPEAGSEQTADMRVD